MDEDDRDSNAFSENDQDDVMEDLDEAEPEPEEDGEEQDEDDDPGAEPDIGTTDEHNSSLLAGSLDVRSANVTASKSNLLPPARAVPGRFEPESSSAAVEGMAVDSAETTSSLALGSSMPMSFTPHTLSSSPLSSHRKCFRVRPEALTARVYDIVPTMAAPQATSINALSVTPDMRYWLTGGSDGYIRKYDGPGTINGRQLLTVAQRHPFVDSVVKAGILMSYWENEEPSTSTSRGTEEHILSPVYSLAIHSRALWLLSGTEGGGINLQSVRHDEGKRIACLQRHTNAVSVLQLAPDEKTVLSGSWDKSIFDWDLNSGQVRRHYDGSGGQISAIELRPASGAPIVTQNFDDEPAPNHIDNTLYSSNGRPQSDSTGLNVAHSDGMTRSTGTNGNTSTNAASVTANGDDTIPDHESLFGSPGGSLFGGSDALGPNPFGDDDIGTAVDMVAGSAAMGNGDVHMGLDNDEGGVGVFEPANIFLHPTIATSGGDGGVTASDANHGELGACTVRAESSLVGDIDTVAIRDIEAEKTVIESSIKVKQEKSISSIEAATTSDSPGGTVLDTGSVSFSPTKQQQDDKIRQQPLQARVVDDQQKTPPPVQNDKLKTAVTSDTTGVSSLPEVVDGSGLPFQSVYVSQDSPARFDPTQVSETTFFSTSINGTVRIWDRRQSLPVARIGIRPGVPPWCMGACWSPDGNRIFAGRRNGIVEEFDIHKARSGWQPERALRFPGGSGPVSAVRAMVNGRHLVCASHDILRLYDLQDTTTRHSQVPFLIIPGPPRAGVISHLYVDRTSRFMISTAGTRGWEGTSTEVLIGYEINCVQK